MHHTGARLGRGGERCRALPGELVDPGAANSGAPDCTPLDPTARSRARGVGAVAWPLGEPQEALVTNRHVGTRRAPECTARASWASDVRTENGALAAGRRRQPPRRSPAAVADAAMQTTRRSPSSRGPASGAQPSRTRNRSRPRRGAAMARSRALCRRARGRGRLEPGSYDPGRAVSAKQKGRSTPPKLRDSKVISVAQFLAAARCARRISARSVSASFTRCLGSLARGGSSRWPRSRSKSRTDASPDAC